MIFSIYIPPILSLLLISSPYENKLHVQEFFKKTAGKFHKNDNKSPRTGQLTKHYGFR